MSEEIFDVVNERDEVVGQAPRQEVHARGLWHRAVHVLVFNARGEIFLQKRSLKKDIAAWKWDSSASGHLDTGEAYDACAVREVREEIGLELYHPSLPPIGGEISPQQGSRPESLNQPVLSNVKTPGAFPPLRVGGVGGADGERAGVRCASLHLGVHGAGGHRPGEGERGLRRLFKLDACRETGWEFCWIYRCVSEGPFTLHPDEIETGAWFSPDAVTRWVNEKPQDFASCFVLIWHQLLAADGHR